MTCPETGVIYSMFPLRQWVTWMWSSRFTCLEGVLSFHCRSHRHEAESSESTGEAAEHDQHRQAWDRVLSLWIPSSLRRKVMTNLDSLLKSRDITLITKVRLVKAMVFPVVMYRCGSWTIKKAEHQRIDAFELWCWRRLLRVPWTARRSNQSILKEISPECSLEGLMLKLKF